VGDWLMPQIDRAYESGKMPALLSGMVTRLEHSIIAVGEGRHNAMPLSR
jgi:hypothetical protein